MSMFYFILLLEFMIISFLFSAARRQFTHLTDICNILCGDLYFYKINDDMGIHVLLTGALCQCKLCKWGT